MERGRFVMFMERGRLADLRFSPFISALRGILWSHGCRVDVWAASAAEPGLYRRYDTADQADVSRATGDKRG